MKILCQVHNASLSIKLLSRVKRERWVHPGRTDAWWINLISGKLKEEEWCLNVRIDVRCFMELVNSIRDYVESNLKSFRSDTVTGEKRVAMVLYYHLKDQGSFRMNSNTFGVSFATLSR